MKIFDRFEWFAGKIGYRIFLVSPALFRLLKQLCVWLYDTSDPKQGMSFFLTSEPLPPKETFEIVVAKYNEDTRWIRAVAKNVTLYTKGDSADGIRLDNKGYEAGTYLHHIAKQYDHLARRTLFFQGNPFDHPVLYISEYITSPNPLVGAFEVSAIGSFSKPWGTVDQPLDARRMRAFLRLMGCDDTIETAHWCWGAQFAVDRALILKKPQEYWQFAYEVSQRDSLVVDDICFDNHHIAMLFELCWWEIFTSDYRSPNVNA